MTRLLLIKKSDVVVIGPPHSALGVLKSTSLEGSQPERTAHRSISFSTEWVCILIAVSATLEISSKTAIVPSANRSHGSDSRGGIADGVAFVTVLKDGARPKSCVFRSLKRSFSFCSAFSVFIEMFRFLEPSSKFMFAAFVMHPGRTERDTHNFRCALQA